MSAVHLAIVGLLGYFLGGIPTAYLAGRAAGVDIRRHGSGNVGGTNAVRVLGWKRALPVMVVDVGKGYVAAWLLPKLPLSGLDPVYLALAGGAGAVLGHVFSPFLRLRGGKGVAAGAGMLLALIPVPVGICAALFALVVLGSGIVSLGSLSAAAALPAVTFLYGEAHPAVRWLTVALAAFVFWTHRSNLRRLLAGKENRFPRPWERRRPTRADGDRKRRPRR
ncbi:MAG: glycerol-3-phosphate 1-O-acyltransferase PlsY [Candidatus Bipolaricaulaceae bacterium]